MANLKTAMLGSATSTYKYGGDGFRYVKVGADGVERYFLRGGGSLIAEYVAAGTQTILAREYVYLGSTLLASVVPSDPPPLDFSVEIVTPTPKQVIAPGQTVNLTALVAVS